jgi:hypothetical protein
LLGIAWSFPVLRRNDLAVVRRANVAAPVRVGGSGHVSQLLELLSASELQRALPRFCG